MAVYQIVENRLHERLKELGLSMTRLGRRMNICRKSLAAWAEGRRVPPLAIALVLAQELACPVEGLFSVRYEVRPDPDDP